MKLTEVPIPQAPPPVTYHLELSFEELVTLALLSHRHELKTGGAGLTFFDVQPDVVRRGAGARAEVLNRNEPGRSIGGGTTTNSINWLAQP